MFHIEKGWERRGEVGTYGGTEGAGRKEMEGTETKFVQMPHTQHDALLLTYPGIADTSRNVASDCVVCIYMQTAWPNRPKVCVLYLLQE